MEGKAELGEHWYAPLPGERPNTELSKLTDQFSGFFKNILMTFYDLVSEGWDPTDATSVANTRAKFDELLDCMGNFEAGYGGLQAHMAREDGRQRNYFTAGLGGKLEASQKLRDQANLCKANLSNPGFNYTAQIGVLRELEGLFALAGVEDSKEEYFDLPPGPPKK